MIQNVVILGSQWGDEGKGKIIDLLTLQDVQYVVRYQGGHNAGHTIIVNNRKVVLHVIPSGILNSDVINIIANGVVLSPVDFIREIEQLKQARLSIDKRLFVSGSCTLVLPYHVATDLAREKMDGVSRNNINNMVVGTTGCGIGPAYEDRIARRAIRISDLYNRENFESKLRSLADYYNFQLEHYYHVTPICSKDVMDEIMSASDILMNMIIDVPELLENARKKGDKVIFEGAQGSLLDIDHGTYPYVTSSHTISGGVSVGTGVGPDYIDYVLGILKAYVTRVGFGPFPTELSGDVGSWLSLHGNEFGSTTGRPRRVGWFDAVLARYSIRLSSISSCCLTKIDVLDGLKEVKICIAYQTSDGKIINKFPYVLEELKYVIPVYETLPGWSSTEGIKDFNNLPKEAIYYIKRIEETIGVPIDIISTGPERSMTIILRNPVDL